MAMPSCNLRDLLVADWAQAALFFPEMDQPLLSFEGIYHLYVKTFFIVAFPFGIVGIGFSTDFGVSFNWHVCGGCEITHLLIGGSVKHPIVSSDRFEVLLRNPVVSFAWVSSFHPTSYRSIDLVVYCVEGFFAHYVLMIERPSPNDGVELRNQFSCA